MSESPVSSCTKRANQLEASAAKDAWTNIVAYAGVVRSAWSEAHSIPSGCGCTPFYSDARRKEAHLTGMMECFARKYGADRLTAWKKRDGLYYGGRS